MTDDEVVAQAQRWARLHGNVKYRDKMDEVLAGLSPEDQRRVYLCGQRIAAGLSAKVVPAADRKEQNGKADQRRQRRKTASGAGTGTTETEVSVGATGEPKKSSHKRSRASGAK